MLLLSPRAKLQECKYNQYPGPVYKKRLCVFVSQLFWSKGVLRRVILWKDTIFSRKWQESSNFFMYFHFPTVLYLFNLHIDFNNDPKWTNADLMHFYDETCGKRHKKNDESIVGYIFLSYTLSHKWYNFEVIADRAWNC